MYVRAINTVMKAEYMPNNVVEMNKTLKELGITYYTCVELKNRGIMLGVGNKSCIIKFGSLLLKINEKLYYVEPKDLRIFFEFFKIMDNCTTRVR